MERHSAILWVILNLMLVHFSHCKTKTSANDLDHHNDGTAIGLDLEPPLQSMSSPSSLQGNQFNEESEIIQGAKDKLLRSILRNTFVEVSRYLSVIDAASTHELSSADETTVDAYAPSKSAVLGSGLYTDQDGADVGSLLKRSSSQPAPLRKRQLNALERAVIRQEILRRLEESKNPMEMPIGLRFRRVDGTGGLSNHYPFVPFVDSFFPTSHRLGYGPSALATRHSQWNSFLKTLPY